MSGGITISSNLASLNTQRHLSESTEKLSRTFDRLSSGLRINRASDDAAGLAIAESLNVDARVFEQGVRNLNDAVSLLNIAEGALSELSNILIRQRELSEQAANGTLSLTQRRAINEEANALRDEFNRIVESTDFNDETLLNLNIENLRIQAGYGLSGSLSFDLGSELARLVGDGTFGTSVSYDVGTAPVSVQAGDFNGDGVPDIVTADYEDGTVSVLLGVGDGTFGTSVSFDVGSGPISVQVGDFNGDGVSDVVTADYYDNTVSVLLGVGDGNFGTGVSFDVGSGPWSIQVGDFNGDGVTDLVTADVWDDTVSVLLGVGDGNFGTSVSFDVGHDPVSVQVGDFNGDGVSDVVTADVDDDTVSVLLGTGDGTFGTRVSFDVERGPESVQVGDFNGDGVSDIVATSYSDDSVSVLLGVGDGNFGASVSFDVGNRPGSVQVEDFNSDGVSDLVTADYNDDTVSVVFGNTTETTTIARLNLCTRDEALDAMEVIDAGLTRVNSEIGAIGAVQSRLATALSTLTQTRENYLAAKSRIVDADVAEESAGLVKNQILQQAGAAVLAQANQAPELALSLLNSA